MLHIKRKIMIDKCRFAIALLPMALLVAACQGGKTAAGDAEGGDTVRLKYARLLTIVRHGGETGSDGKAKSTGAKEDGSADSKGYDYAEAIIRNPWKKGGILHRYILVPKGREGDETLTRLARQASSQDGASVAGAVCDTVRTPIESSVVFTSPHCQLMYELGAEQAIRGVCDLGYINIPDVKKRVAGKMCVDCGSSMAPDIERIIALRPQALLISPFENSGGYGKLDKLRIPIIETADYMETSPLGRAEWMKFYGMLFGEKVEAGKSSPSPAEQGRYVSCEMRADSLFARIEKEYLSLKAQAAEYPKGLSILTERKMGNVWYVPGGQSTIGVLLKDANARYIFEDDTHSGSLAMSPEQILAKGKKVDVWAFKYFEPQPLTRPQLLQEYKGYEALLAFNTKDIYECSTSSQPYFELTSFHPEILLREFIILAHQDSFFGKLRFYKPMNTPDDLPVWGKTEECR